MKQPQTPSAAPTAAKNTGSGDPSAAKVRRRPAPAVKGAACRAAAARCLEAVMSGHSLTEAQERFAGRLNAADKALCAELCYGCLRHLTRLKLTVESLSSKKVSDSRVLALALVGLYQCSLLDRLPPHAAVSATVGACGLIERRFAASFVNALLRRFLREGAQLITPEKPWERCSFPQWIYELWQADYGQETAAALMEQSNAHAPMFLRVETSKIKTAALARRLSAAGLKTAAWQESGLIELKEPCQVGALPGFAEGLVSVQDLAAQAAVPLLELADGQQVLDCCCAPGGKSAQILDQGFNLHLTCLDADKERLWSAAKQLARLKRLPQKEASSARDHYETEGLALKAMDAVKLRPSEGLYDRILLDAPCSGSGVIRRHPDIKWLRRESDVQALTMLQSRLLDAAFACLKPGGLLVYSTCSVFKAENERQIEAFLARTPEAELVPFALLGKTAGYVQRLTGEEGGDGFFYARVRRRA